MTSKQSYKVLVNTSYKSIEGNAYGTKSVLNDGQSKPFHPWIPALLQGDFASRNESISLP